MKLHTLTLKLGPIGWSRTEVKARYESAKECKEAAILLAALYPGSDIVPMNNSNDFTVDARTYIRA